MGKVINPTETSKIKNKDKIIREKILKSEEAISLDNNDKNIQNKNMEHIETINKKINLDTKESKDIILINE
jgi:hypothetical protein